jgi:hypothetical protein
MKFVPLDYTMMAAQAVEFARALDKRISELPKSPALFEVSVAMEFILSNERAYRFLYENKVPVGIADKRGIAHVRFADKEDAKMFRDICNDELHPPPEKKTKKKEDKPRHPDNFKGLVHVAYGPDHHRHMGEPS